MAGCREDGRWAALLCCRMFGPVSLTAERSPVALPSHMLLTGCTHLAIWLSNTLDPKDGGNRTA
jgi:hypothetical protein